MSRRCIVVVVFGATGKGHSLFHFYLSALTFTLVGIFGGLVMLIAIVYVPLLFAYVGFSTEFEFLVRVGRWPFLALVVLGLLAVLYRVGLLTRFYAMGVGFGRRPLCFNGRCAVDRTNS